LDLVSVGTDSWLPDPDHGVRQVLGKVALSTRTPPPPATTPTAGSASGLLLGAVLGFGVPGVGIPGVGIPGVLGTVLITGRVLHTEVSLAGTLLAAILGTPAATPASATTATAAAFARLAIFLGRLGFRIEF
jgi:hypothetical protein